MKLQSEFSHKFKKNNFRPFAAPSNCRPVLPHPPHPLATPLPGSATLCERGKRSKDRVELQTATGRPDATAAALTLISQRSAGMIWTQRLYSLLLMLDTVDSEQVHLTASRAARSTPSTVSRSLTFDNQTMTELSLMESRNQISLTEH